MIVVRLLWDARVVGETTVSEELLPGLGPNRLHVVFERTSPFIPPGTRLEIQIVPDGSAAG